MENVNLWGKLPQVNIMETPLSILKIQAQKLSEISSGQLVGEVVVRSQAIENFVADLLIKAPTLGGYTIGLLTIQYGLDMYPVNVINRLTQLTEVGSDSESYLRALKDIFQDQKTVDVLSSLLLQIKAADFAS